MIGQTLGHYRILEQIGVGGMSEVYLALDERLDREVAIKVLRQGALADKTIRKRLRKEAQALSKISHPNIETLLEFDSIGDVEFLVVEYVAGVPLSDILSRGPLAEKEIARLGVQLASGLAAAHAQRVVHCDLKPANLRITSDGRLKILDFGIARLSKPSQETTVTDTTTKSTSGDQAAVGTLPYMAPEQLQSQPVDARTDICAAGAVLYEMATGQRPFREETAPRLIDAILHQPPVPPRAVNAKISTELERVILKCLEKEPENRYQSASDLEVDLRRLASPQAVASGPAIRRRLIWARRPRLAAGFVVLLAGILAGLMIARWRKQGLRRSSVGRIDSMAVLPLQNLSGDPEQEYFADGMTDVLIADLSQISALRVISRTSVMQYKGTRKALPQIAKELGVDAVVEGSVQRSANRVRITAQLIYAPAEGHLWAESYERDLRDILGLQSEVARAIADEIRIKVTSQEQARLSGARPVSPDAYEAYLKGRYYWNKRTPEDLRKGAEYFQKSVDVDPTYALAYAGLADGYILLADQGELSPREAIPRAKAAAKRALDLDDSLAEAHVSLAATECIYDWDLTAAGKEFKRALALNPNYATAREWHGLYLTQVGRFDEAIREMQRAQELDPLSLVIEVNVGRCYYYARLYDRAVELLGRFAQREPSFWVGHAILGQTYLVMGRLNEAIAELERAQALLPDIPRNLGVLGDAYARAGRRVEAEKLAKHLGDLSRKRYVSPVYTAMIYTGLGEKPQALAFLEKAYADRSDWMPKLQTEPEFDLLRTDPRFRALLRRVGREGEKEARP